MTSTKPGRLTLASRAKALEAGIWQRQDGSFEKLREMQDTHLVYALLKATEEGLPVTITKPLAEEVGRRNLEDYATKLADRRWRKGGSHDPRQRTQNLDGSGT